jgi:hypothetical protein
MATFFSITTGAGGAGMEAVCPRLKTAGSMKVKASKQENLFSMSVHFLDGKSRNHSKRCSHG